MFLRRCVAVTCWLVAGLYLLRQPVSAAHTVTAVLRGLAGVADALARFVSAL